MRVLKLHLQKPITYLCTSSQEMSIKDIHSSLISFKKLCWNSGITCYDSECLFIYGLFDSDFPVSSRGFGTSPVASGIDPLPPQFFLYSIEPGKYVFYQFQDSSLSALQSAYRKARSELQQKNWTPLADKLLVRGIQEDSAFSMQILIPIADS